MDGRTDPLNDAALEQEIEALLSAEPSPGFVARVRSRVAEESMSGGWEWRWPIAAAATAVAVAVVGIALWQQVEPTSPPTPQLTAESLEGSAPKPPGPDIVPHQVVSVVAPRRSIDIPLPPVLIAENETRAFAVLVRTASTTRFAFVSPAVPSGAPLEVEKMPRIDPVNVDPIVIRPLVNEMTAE